MIEKPMARRDVLKVGSATALVGVAAAPVAALIAQKGPKIHIADLDAVPPLEPLSFTYPDGSPAMLLDAGEAVAGGVGPNRSLIAFSTLCQHMGCPLGFDDTSRRFVCGCHASVFDPRRAGMAVEGPATRGLPRVVLTVEDGAVYAIGIAEGLVYGHACHT